MSLDCPLFGETPDISSIKDRYASNLKEKLCTAYETVRATLKVSQKRQKDYYDNRIAGKHIEVGDKVLLFNPAVKPGMTHKLSCPWGTEPYTVVEKISDIDFRIKRGKQKTKIVHYNRLKKYPIHKDGDETEIQTQPSCPDDTRKSEKGKRKRNVLEQQVAAPDSFFLPHHENREQQIAAPEDIDANQHVDSHQEQQMAAPDYSKMTVLMPVRVKESVSLIVASLTVRKNSLNLRKDREDA